MPETAGQRVRRELIAAGANAEALPVAGGLGVLVAAARVAGVSEGASLRAVGAALGVPFIESLAGLSPSGSFAGAVPIGFARKQGLMGFDPAEGEDRVRVALSDVAKWDQVQVIARQLGRPVTPILSPAAAVLDAIDRAYQQRTGQAQEHIDALEPEDEDADGLLAQIQRLSARDDLLDNATRAPVVKLVNLVLFEAVKADASDVHVQPYEDRLVVRMRVDGVLYDSYTLPKSIQEEVVSRIKVMGKMNIAEKRLPQDGRATVSVGRRAIDLRIATLPTSKGERVVLRLLDKGARLYELPELGMDARTLSRFEQLITLEHGLILVTGPTGSGKTTTLYSALNRINGKEKNVLTLEDPIEYELEGVSQTQVSYKKGMTFASGLRSVLRQDPDVIMVGEIRDLETATMAIQSSLTGHLVFSTLHTNDAATAVTRLLDLGIEPYLASSSLVGVLAQRLVRRVCPTCAAAYEATDEDLQWLNVDSSRATRLRRGAGCAQCRHTGYRGRLGAFELLVLDDNLRRSITTRATASELKAAAVSAGMHTLRQDGVRQILAGVTTIAEVERVTMSGGGAVVVEELV